MIRKRRLWLTAKYLTYTLTMILLYAIQTAPGLFSVKGIRPMWVIPFAVGIAMCEEALSASLFGMLAGLLCDLGTQSLFGFNGLLMLAGCWRPIWSKPTGRAPFCWAVRWQPPERFWSFSSSISSGDTKKSI